LALGLGLRARLHCARSRPARFPLAERRQIARIWPPIVGQQEWAADRLLEQSGLSAPEESLAQANRVAANQLAAARHSRFRRQASANRECRPGWPLIERLRRKGVGASR